MADAKVILTAQNNIKAGLDSAKGDVLGFGDAAKKVGDTLKNAFTVLAIIEGLKGLASAAGDCFREFAEGERRSTQLKIALDNNVDSFNKNTELIGKMSQVTMSSKDDVEALVTELATLGKSDKEIEAITRASVNLSNVTGKDLNSSFQMVNATMEGSAGKLGKLIPEMGNLTAEQLKSGAATQFINDKFTEMSEKLAERNISQKLKNINDDIGDIKEGIGQVIAVEFGPLISKFGTFISESKGKIVTIFQTIVAIFKNFPEIAKLSFGLVLDIIQTAFSWNGLKIIFISLAKYIGETLALAITSLPTLFIDVVKLMFAPIKSLADYIADSLDKAFKLDFKNIKSPGDAIKDMITNTASAAGKLVTDLVAVVGKQANNIKDLGVNLSHVLDPLEPKFEAFDKNVQAVIGKDMAAYNSEDTTGVPALPSTTGPRVTPTTTPTTSKPEKDINDGTWVTDEDIKAGFAKQNQDWFIGFKNYSFNTSLALTGALKTLSEVDPIKPIDNEKWGPAKSGSMSASGYKFNKDYWDQFGELPKYTDEQLQAKFAPVKTGMYSAANYRLAKDQWDQFGLAPKYTDEQLQEKFAPVKKGMYSAAGYKLAKDEWDTFGNLPKYTDEELMEKFAPVKTGMYSAAGYKLNKDYWEEFGNLPKYTDEQLQKMFEPVKKGMYSAAGYKLAKQEWDLFGDPDKEGAINGLKNYYSSQAGSNGQSGVTPSQLGAGGASIADQMASLNSSKPSFFQNLLGDFQGVFTDIKSSFGSGFMDTITGSGLGGGDIMGSLSGMFGELAGALGPLTQILFSANPIMAALLPVIEGAVSILGPAITEVIQPLMNALTSIGETIGIALLPILDAISPIFAILANILQAVLMPVIQLLSPFINIIALQFQYLSPLLILVAKAFTILMSPVQFVADLFSWVGKWIATLGTNIGVFVYNLSHWLNPKSYAEGPDGFSSDAFSGLQAKLDAIDNIGQTDLAGSATTSTNTASQSASYSGGNTITINIYQQAPIVGDGGMTELARRIRTEIATLDYYNN